ncbi:hypothetical protein [Delftia sp. PE138]|uniref:hypothetical protein n=1 Tax=Delftia sp. PE138 TaxID=1812483 RepID=UPI001BB09812|nr:hypothetical protein [Delftia sp. PE138]MBS3719420.1 hypothetical protein [Delftia sp. PE138]
MTIDARTAALPAPPYPAETRAKGWRFELDLERIEQSDTWALAPADLRPWLLMLWATAWKQVPCGSLPDDDQLVAVRIGMKPAQFAKARAVLMRGWWRADDGRLYHDTVAARVLDMLGAKVKERQRKADYRKRREAEEAAGRVGDGHVGDPGNRLGVPDMSHGTNLGQNGDGHVGDPGRDDTGTGTGTGTGTRLHKDSVADATDGGGSPPAPPLPRPLDPPDGSPKEKTPEHMAKAELWNAAVSVLEQGGCPKAQARSFMGKLVKDYGQDVVRDAVAAAVTAQPVDAREYLRATCQHAAGQRQHTKAGAPAQGKHSGFTEDYYANAGGFGDA